MLESDNYGILNRRKVLDNDNGEKVEILKLLEAGNRAQAHISREFSISKQMISDHVKYKGKIVGGYEASHSRGRRHGRCSSLSRTK